MPDVVTTIAADDRGFGAALTRIDTFADAFKRKVESIGQGRNGMFSGGKFDPWSGRSNLSAADTDAYLRWLDRRQMISNAGSAVGSAFGAAQNVIGAVGYGINIAQSVANLADEFERSQRAAVRMREALSGIATDVSRSIDRGKISSDPRRNARFGSYLDVSGGATSVLGSAAQQLEDQSGWGSMFSGGNVMAAAKTLAVAPWLETRRYLRTVRGSLRSWWNWDDSYAEDWGNYGQVREAALSGYGQSTLINRKAIEMSRQNTALFDSQNHLDRLRGVMDDGVGVRVNRLSAINLQRESKERAERGLELEHMLGQAQEKRLRGDERGAEILETRVKYLTRILELEGQVGISQDTRDRMIRQQNSLMEQSLAGMNQQQKAEIFYRGIDASTGGSAAQAAAQQGTGKRLADLVEQGLRTLNTSVSSIEKKVDSSLNALSKGAVYR